MCDKNAEQEQVSERDSFIADGKEIYGHEREPLVENPLNFPLSDAGGLKDGNLGGDK